MKSEFYFFNKGSNGFEKDKNKDNKKYLLPLFCREYILFFCETLKDISDKKLIIKKQNIKNDIKNKNKYIKNPPVLFYSLKKNLTISSLPLLTK